MGLCLPIVRVCMCAPRTWVESTGRDPWVCAFPLCVSTYVPCVLAESIVRDFFCTYLMCVCAPCVVVVVLASCPVWSLSDPAPAMCIDRTLNLVQCYCAQTVNEYLVLLIYLLNEKIISWAWVHYIDISIAPFHFNFQFSFSISNFVYISSC